MQRSKRIISTILACTVLFSSMSFLAMPNASALDLPPEVPHGEVIYQNGFESATPLSGATQTPSSSSTVIEKDGGHVLQSVSGALFGIGNTAWQNYVVSAEITVPSANYDPGSGASTGLVFRYTDNKNFYHFRWDSKGHLQLYKWVGGTATKLTEIAYTNFQLDTKYIMTVIAAGNNIRCYFDGVQVIDYTDTKDPYLSGSVGFRTYNTKSLYDNLNVWNLATPSADITSIFENQTLTNFPVTISGTITGSYSADLILDGGEPTPLSISNNTFSYTFYPHNKAYSATIRAYNVDKSSYVDTTRNFTVAIPEQPLTATLAQTVDVSVDVPISIQFSCPVDAATISSIHLLKGSTPVDTSVTVSQDDNSGSTVAIPV